MRLFSAVLLALTCGSVLLTWYAAAGTLVPEHYDLHLILDPYNRFLNGTVRIKVHVANKTDIVYLSANPNITIKSTLISHENDTSNGNPVVVNKVEKTPAGKLSLHLNQKLAKNRTFILQLQFEGIRPDSRFSNTSMYLLNVADKSSQKNRTYFILDLTKKNTFAAFPCFYNSNNPAWKTTISLNVTYPRSFDVATISAPCAPSVSSKQFPGFNETTYSKVHPSYIEDFALIATTDRAAVYVVSKNETVKCPNQTIQYTMSKEMFHCMVHHISSFFGTPMPTNSITIVLTPASVSNCTAIYVSALGLFTSSEEIIKRGNPSNAFRHILYDLSKQWIKYSVHSINPNSSSVIRSLQRFSAENIAEKIVLNSNASESHNFSDSLTSSHMSLVTIPWENKNIIPDYHEYREKLTLNMVKEILGEKLFTEGLADLLSKSNHNPIKDDDLWRHLTHIAMKYEAFDVPDFPQSVEEIVKPFLNSSLFSIPLLEFDFDFYGSFGGFIRQIPFAFTRTKYDSEKYESQIGSPLWKVPIQLVLESDKFISQQRNFVWAKTRNRAIALTNFNQKEILLLNPGIRGPFIVKYRKNNWDMIFERFESIPIKLRRQLFNDMHVLAHSSHYNYTEYFRYILKLKPKETNLPFWTEYVSAIRDVDKRLFGKPYELATKLFTKQLNVVYKLSNESKSNSTFWMKELRSSIDEYLCRRSLSSRNYTEEYENLVTNFRSITNGSTPFSHCATKNLTLVQWQNLVDLYLKNYNSFSNCAHKFIKDILTSVDNKEAIYKYLHYFFDDVADPRYSNLTLRECEFEYDLRNIKSTRTGSLVLFDYFIHNIEKLRTRFPAVFKTITKISLENLRSEEEIKQALEFLQNKNLFKKEEMEIVDNAINRLKEQLELSKTTFLEIEKLLTEALKDPQKYLGY